ncbi:flagellar basal body P-ring formation chaperone FlgA [Photobacterium sp. GB-1]|uniref:flagellar basal body P-ring formation chaperone FlgA n=1 Tax=Photobacterium sp. GB-1 TaxID=2022111 RepID=UPI001E65DEBA|nr:flagellar basal body P-ring formation chaperone FlgA [Photobacterium sp. GB-1]
MLKILEVVSNPAKKAFVSLTYLIILVIFLPFSVFADNLQEVKLITSNSVNIQKIKSALVDEIKNEIQHYSDIHGWKKVVPNINVNIPKAISSLPHCPEPVRFTAQDNQSQPVGRLKRQVKCESPTVNWRLNATVYVQLTLPVMVARTLIHRDEVITMDMLDSKKLQLKAPKNIITDADQVIGLHAIRRIRQGQLITENVLKKPFLINKGDQVLIVAKKGKFEASTKGMALEHGKMYEQIKVENTATQKVIHARVVAQGKVETIF